jgi:hypothetical protein
MLPGVTGAQVAAVVTRRVSVASGAAVVNDAPVEQAASVQVAPPRVSPTLGVAPRLSSPHLLRARPGAFATDLQPADRFTAGGVEYEALSFGRALSFGIGIVGHETPVMPVSFLFPASGQAHDQGSAPSGPEIPVAIWQPIERHAITGSYEDLQGDAPVEFAADLTGRNRLLTVGTTRYRVVTATVDLTAPRVDLKLTRAG